MSENVSDIAKLIADGETTLDGEELCTRGLEHIVEEELADYRAEKMINSIDAVLDEQEEQWDEGKEEPGLIAELYAEYAKPLLREAHMIGLEDAQQGYKGWDELMKEKDYIKLAKKQNTSPSLTGRKVVGKTEKVGKAKKTKKASSSAFSDTRKTEKIGTVKMKVQKNKVQEQLARNKPTKQYVPTSEKRKVKRTSSKNSTQPSLDDSSSSSSSSFQMLPPTTSSGPLRHQSSSSSINSCTLRDLSVGSTSEEFDTMVESEKYIPAKGKVFSSVPTKKNTSLVKSKQKLSLQRNVKDPPKKQRKTQPRRTALDRKNGSELSPFVFRRDGTLTFRKPDVEKLKREEKNKRKNCIRGAMTKFIYGDEEEVDILASILAGK
jgi:hypothetical protein